MSKEAKEYLESRNIWIEQSDVYDKDTVFQSIGLEQLLTDFANEQTQSLKDEIERLNEALMAKIQVCDVFRSELAELKQSNTWVSVEEVIKYIENDSEIAIPIDRFFIDGNHITKKEYGLIVLEILCKELRNKFGQPLPTVTKTINT